MVENPDGKGTISEIKIRADSKEKIIARRKEQVSRGEEIVHA